MDRTVPAEHEPRPGRALAALRWAQQRAGGGGAQPPPPAEDADFLAAAKQDAPGLRRQLDAILLAPEPEAGLDALLASGGLAALLPAVQQMVGFSDGEWRHKDVWKHTKQVVRQSSASLQVRWAALLHDIGKVKTRSIDDSGRVHFLGHAKVGARMLDRMERRFGLFADDRRLYRTVRFLVLHHLRASQYAPSWTDSAVRRFAREMGAHLDALLSLSRADITTKRPERKRRGLEQIDELQRRIGELAALDARRPPLPKGVGDEIMAAFGIPPSRRIGDIKRNLEQAVAAGRIPPGLEAEAYVAYLHDNPSLLAPPEQS